MRQISTDATQRRRVGDLRARRARAGAPRARQPRARSRSAPGATRSHRAASADPAKARRHPGPAPPRPLTRAPSAGALLRALQLWRRRQRRREQHDLRAPPQPVAIALGLMRHHARGLQVIQPALHAAPVRTHEPRPPGRVARHRTLAHHRRQPRHQLPDRGRKPRRALRMTQPEHVALDRVRPRLQPIIAWCLAPPRSVRAGVHHQPPVRARLDRRPIPDEPRARRADARSSGTANTRRRRGSTKHCAHKRTLAAQLEKPRPGRAGGASDAGRRTPKIGVGDPSGAQLQMGQAFSRALLSELCARQGRVRRPGCYPVFVVLGQPSAGGPRQRREAPTATGTQVFAGRRRAGLR